MAFYRPSDDGSVAMVLLAALVIGGVIGALFITVDTGVETARRDRNWHAAINAADAGVQEAVSVIREDDVEGACPGGTCTGQLDDGGSYVATYTETPLGYEVCSVGEFNGVTRQACAQFDLNLLIGGAGVIGLDLVRLDGSSSGIVTPIIIGTAGEFQNVTNSCSKIEEVEIYNDSQADNPCSDQPVTRTPRMFTNIAEYEFTEGACSNPADVWTAYPSQPAAGDSRQPWTYGEEYCTRLVDIPSNVNIQLNGDPADGPVRVFVDPGDTSSAAAKYAGNGTVNANGSALDLQFYIRQGSLDLDMKGTTAINAVWYAPASTCDVRGNVTFTGAVVCKRVDLGGSVNFIVPDDIRTLRAGPTVLDRWFEQ